MINFYLLNEINTVLLILYERLLCFFFLVSGLATGLKWVWFDEEKVMSRTYMHQSGCCNVFVTCHSNLIELHPHSPDQAD